MLLKGTCCIRRCSKSTAPQILALLNHGCWTSTLRNVGWWTSTLKNHGWWTSTLKKHGCWTSTLKNVGCQESVVGPGSDQSARAAITNILTSPFLRPDEHITVIILFMSVQRQCSIQMYSM